MSPPADPVYTPLRHAFVGEDSRTGPDVLGAEWVLIARWEHTDGTFETCVEVLDQFLNEIIVDRCFPTEEEAVELAVAEFGFGPDDWHDGVPWVCD